MLIVDHPGAVQFVRRDAPSDVVAFGPVGRLPPHVGGKPAAGTTHRLHAADGRRGRTVAAAEDPQAGYRAGAPAGHVDDRQPHVPRPHGRGKLDVIVRPVQVAVATVGHHLPRRAVHRPLQQVAMEEAGPLASPLGAVVLGEVDLHGVHAAGGVKVHLEPLPAPAVARPVRPHILVEGVAGSVAGQVRGGRRALAVRQQHPAGEGVGPGVPRRGRQAHGIIAEEGVAEQHAVGVESGGEQADPPLEHVLDGDAQGGGVPEVAVPVVEAASVSGAGDEAAGLEREGVVRRVLERSQRRGRGVDPVAVNVERRTRRGVLQVVHAVLFGHPRPFDPRGVAAAVVLAASLPAVQVGASDDQVDVLADRLERGAVEPDGTEGMSVRAAVVEVDLPVVVLKQVGVPVREAVADVLPRIPLGIDGPVDGAASAAARGREVQRAVDDADIRCVVFGRQHGRRHEGPLAHVARVPVAAGLGGEQEELAVKGHDRGVRRLAMGCRAVFDLKAVAQVQRITECRAHIGHTFGSFSNPYSCSQTARQRIVRVRQASRTQHTRSKPAGRL